MTSHRVIRVVHVINTAAVGGGAEHVLVLTQALADHGYEPTVVVGQDGPAQERLRQAGVPVVVLGPMGVTAPLRLASVLRRLRPAILHLHGSRAGFVGTIAAGIAGVRPVVYTAHAFAFKRELPAVLRWLAARADALTCARAAQVICLTRRDVDAARRLGVLRNHATVIPNGIDPARFASRPDRRAELGIDPTAPVAGMVGRLVPDKDPVGFVIAARRVLDAMPDARFVLVGDGPLRGAVEAAVERHHLGSHMMLTGYRADVPELLATMDVVVLTSRWEGMPLVILEAMASGRPVIAPALPGLDEVIENGVTGLLVPPGDPVALGEAVVAVLRDPATRRSMGAHARARAHREFSLEDMIKPTLDVYRATLAAHGKPTP